MVLAITVILMVVGVAFLSLLPAWLTHLSMTKDYTNITGWSNYKKFKEHFNKAKWRYDTAYKYSLFDEIISGENNEYHAGIIKFNGVGMKINNPISYLMVCLYAKKYIRDTYGYTNNYKW